MAEVDTEPVRKIAPRVAKPAVAEAKPVAAPQPDMHQLVSVLQSLATSVSQNTQLMQQTVAELTKPPVTPEPVALPTHNQSAFLQAAINNNKLQNHVFGVVVIPDSGVPERRSFNTIEDLLEYLTEFVNTPTHVFPYVGEPFYINRVQGVHCLATSQGDFPLSPREAPVEAVGSWLGGAQPAPLADEAILEPPS